MTLTQKHIQQITTLFKQFDKDGSGSVSNQEVQGMLAKFGLKLNMEQVNKLVLLVDENDSGEIDLEEFIQLVKYALDPKSVPKNAAQREAKKKMEVKTRSFGATNQPIFVFLSNDDPKYLQLLTQAIKFLKRNTPEAYVGIITPPDTPSIQSTVESQLTEIDAKLNTSNIRVIQGKKRFDDWNNTQLLFDIEVFAEEFDPVVYLDVDTVILRTVLPYVETFASGKQKYGFLHDYVTDYPNFKEKWDGQPFIPQTSLILFKSPGIPKLFSTWKRSWAEWIEPSPFIVHKDPARFYKQSRIAISQYSLAQAVFKTVNNFDEEVLIIGRHDLSIARNYGLEAQKQKYKFLSAGSSYSNEGPGKITITVQNGEIFEKQDVGLNKGDPFVSVKVGDWEKQTKTLKNTQNPVWDQDLVFDNVTYADAAAINFSLWDYDGLSKNDLIGTATLSLLNNKTHDEGAAPQPVTLSVVDAEGVQKATINVEGTYYVEVLSDDDEPKTRSFSGPVGLYSGVADVTLDILSGKIKNKHDVVGEDDPYVKINIGGVEKETRHLSNTNTPQWDQTLSFSNVAAKDAQAITITLWDWDKFTKHDLIGTAKLNLLPYTGKKQRVSLSLIGGDGAEEGKIEINALVTPLAYAP